MQNSRFTKGQIAAILRERDAGVTASDLGREHSIHANTIRDRYGGFATSDLVRLKRLEDENRRKDRVIARLSSEVEAMRELVEKKGRSPRIVCPFSGAF